MISDGRDYAEWSRSKLMDSLSVGAWLTTDQLCAVRAELERRATNADAKLARLTAAAREVEVHKNDSGSAVLSRAIDALAAILEEP